MISLLTLILFYFIIVFILASIVASIVAYLRSESSQDRLLWMSVPIVLSLILISIVIEFCITFYSNIMEAINLNLVTNCALMFAFLSAATFMSMIIIVPGLIKK